MSEAGFQAEFQATTSWFELLKRAEDCRALHERLGMPVPARLRRFLGLEEESNGKGQASAVVSVSGPTRASWPLNAGADWIWVDVASATTGALVLAVLRQAGGPLRARDVVKQVHEIRPDIPKGSIANIGTRMTGTQIERGSEGWWLPDPGRAGVLFDGQIFGPDKIFGKYELAAHRRLGILHLLSLFAVGLQSTQIEEHLQAASWMRAPVNKDLLKADLEVLAAEGKIRRRGNSRKWELSEESNVRKN